MSTRAIRAGQTITLQARFKDDLGDNAEAEYVHLYVFDPDADVDDLSSASVVSGEATYFDQGIFQYEFDVPNIGPDGLWQDLWFGTLNGQLLSGWLSFEVSANGTIEELGNQLNLNNIVEVVLSSGILATDGTALGEEESFYFLTPTSPRYSDQRKVRLEIGGFIADLHDDTIEQAILEASIEAETVTFGTIKNTKLYEHARREYVTCNTGLLLLSNLNSNLKAKTLDNLHVEYDTQAVRDAINRLQDCVAKWEGQVIAAGYSRTAQQPVVAVKGENDPDRPIVGRSWYSTDLGGMSRRYPASNDRVQENWSRRAKGTFTPRKRFW